MICPQKKRHQAFLVVMTFNVFLKTKHEPIRVNMPCKSLDHRKNIPIFIPDFPVVVNSGNMTIARQLLGPCKTFIQIDRGIKWLSTLLTFFKIFFSRRKLVSKEKLCTCTLQDNPYLKQL